MVQKEEEQQKDNLEKNYSLLKTLGKTPLEVADPIAFSNYFPKKASEDKSPENK